MTRHALTRHAPRKSPRHSGAPHNPHDTLPTNTTDTRRAQQDAPPPTLSTATLYTQTTCPQPPPPGTATPHAPNRPRPQPRPTAQHRHATRKSQGRTSRTPTNPYATRRPGSTPITTAQPHRGRAATVPRWCATVQRTLRRTGSTSQTPTQKQEPFATHSGTKSGRRLIYLYCRPAAFEHTFYSQKGPPWARSGLIVVDV